MSRRALAIAGTLAVAAACYVLLIWLPRWTSRATTGAAAAPSPVAPAPPGRKIKARLFYVAEDGIRLTSVERDIAYGDSAVEQAREIVAAQIAPVVEPLVSAVPPNTTLRAVFITEGGDAYVDLSREVVSAHPGERAADGVHVRQCADDESAGRHRRPDAGRRQGARHAFRPHRSAPPPREKPRVGTIASFQLNAVT